MRSISKIFVITLALVFASKTLAGPLPEAAHIYVEGTAEVEVAPDQMIISVGLSAENQDVDLAKQDVDKRSHQLLDALKKLQIDAADISTTALQISPVFDYVEGRREPRGTRVYRQVEITLRQLENYGQMMQALMDAKVANTVDTRLEVSDERAVSDQALIEALKDAKNRAAALVESTGGKLGKVHSISEFNLRQDESHRLVPNKQVYGVSSERMAMDQGRGEPFEPGMIRAKAQVYVVYLIR